jgi:hypothetical protein
MNDPDSIIEQIDKTLEELDQLITPLGDKDVGEYAARRANEKYLEKKLKAIIAIEKAKHEGSDAARTTLAEASKAYQNALWDLSTAQGLSYQVQATKDLLEARLDSLRTKLSFHKSQIQKI